jgi:hypothetical protein
MLTYLKTPAVSGLLGVSYWQITSLLRTRTITPPAKDSSGDYVWTEEDVERARQALAARRRRGVPHGPLAS